MFSRYEKEKCGLKTGTIRGIIPTDEHNLSILPCFVGDAENHNNGHNNRLFEHIIRQTLNLCRFKEVCTLKRCALTDRKHQKKRSCTDKYNQLV